MVHKKGQLNALPTSVVLLVIAAVFLVFGLIMLQEFRDTDAIAASASRSFTNETLVTVAETGENTACAAYPAGACSIGDVTNATSGTLVPTTNYTITNCNVAYSSGGNSEGFNNSNWNVTYSCTYGDTSYLASNSTLTGLGTFADFWEIIVLAVVIGVIIAILIIVFGRQRR